jgi:hypothetical protein
VTARWAGWRRVAGLPVIAAALAAGAGAAAAQVCEGLRPLEWGRVHVAAGAASHTYASAVDASVTAGQNAYMTVNAARTHDAEIHATAWDIGISGGYDGALDPRRAGFVCPRAALSLSLGPRDYMLSEIGFRRAEASVGLGLAMVAHVGPVTFVPVAGASVHRLRATPVTDADVSGWLDPASDTYVVVSLAVGVRMGGRVTLRPGLTVPLGLVEAGSHQDYVAPFGREEAELSLGITMAILIR